jgi:hypothetical protein
MKNGFTITNSHTPAKTSLTVSKTWSDANDQDGIRPEEVTIKLLADGEPTDKTLILNSTNAWTDSFIDLDEYAAGEKINYTVEEVSIAGYSREITGSMENGFIITNSHTPEPTITEPTITEPTITEPTITTTTTTTTEAPTTTTTTEEATTTTTEAATTTTIITEAPTTTTTTEEITTTIPEIVAGDEDEKTTPTTTQPSEVVAGDEDEVDVVPTGENYLYFVVAILFILSGAVVLVPAIKKVRVKK